MDVSAQQALATALTFHASFDNGADADFGLGDKRVYTAPTYKNLDAAQPGLHARFFLNGKLQGSTEPIPEPFTWDLSRAKIRLGVNYAGLFDDLSVFNRALSESEVQTLYGLKAGVSTLHR